MLCLDTLRYIQIYFNNIALPHDTVRGLSTIPLIKGLIVFLFFVRNFIRSGYTITLVQYSTVLTVDIHIFNTPHFCGCMFMCCVAIITINIISTVSG